MNRAAPDNVRPASIDLWARGDDAEICDWDRGKVAALPCFETNLNVAHRVFFDFCAIGNLQTVVDQDYIEARQHAELQLETDALGLVCGAV